MGYPFQGGSTPTNRQVSVIKTTDELGYKKRLEQEGRRVRATMMIRGDKNNVKFVETPRGGPNRCLHFKGHGTSLGASGDKCKH